MTTNNQVQFLDKIKTTIILPEDLLIKIYKDYLEADVYYMIYKNIIELQISQRLDEYLLSQLIPIILSKPIVCKYIREKCPAFCSSFIKHKIDNNKVFTLMKKGQSFAATILFTLYH
jgi:hypothetical protein